MNLRRPPDSHLSAWISASRESTGPSAGEGQVCCLPAQLPAPLLQTGLSAATARASSALDQARAPGPLSSSSKRQPVAEPPAHSCSLAASGHSLRVLPRAPRPRCCALEIRRQCRQSDSEPVPWWTLGGLFKETTGSLLVSALSTGAGPHVRSSTGDPGAGGDRKRRGVLPLHHSHCRSRLGSRSLSLRPRGLSGRCLLRPAVPAPAVAPTPCSSAAQPGRAPGTAGVSCSIPRAAQAPALAQGAPLTFAAACV